MGHVGLNPIFFELWTKLSCTKLSWTLLPRALNCSGRCSRELLYVVLDHTAMLFSWSSGPCCLLQYCPGPCRSLLIFPLYNFSLMSLLVSFPSPLFWFLLLRFFSYDSHLSLSFCLSVLFFPSVSLPLSPSVSLFVSLVHYFSPLLSPYVSKSLFLHLFSPPSPSLSQLLPSSHGWTCQWYESDYPKYHDYPEHCRYEVDRNNSGYH
jgi:hypothetical protein